MSKIREGHPRYGAKVGDVVDEWECTVAAWFVFRGNSRLSGEKTRAEADRMRHVFGPKCPTAYAVRRVTIWRRVRPKLRWATLRTGFGLYDLGWIPLFMPHAHGVDAAPNGKWMPLEYPPHVTTDEQRKRFCERVARLYGYEVER